MMEISHYSDDVEAKRIGAAGSSQSESPSFSVIALEEHKYLPHSSGGGVESCVIDYVKKQKGDEARKTSPPISTSQLMELEIYAQLHPELEISLNKNGLHIGRPSLCSPVCAEAVGQAQTDPLPTVCTSPAPDNPNGFEKGAEGTIGLSVTPFGNAGRNAFHGTDATPAKPFSDGFVSEESESVRAAQVSRTMHRQLEGQEARPCRFGQSASRVPAPCAPLREAKT